MPTKILFLENSGKILYLGTQMTSNRKYLEKMKKSVTSFKIVFVS